jgi:hypothetical protein
MNFRENPARSNAAMKNWLPDALAAVAVLVVWGWLVAFYQRARVKPRG